MGREVRRVPADWSHPKDERGKYMPQYDRSGGYRAAAAEWDLERESWERGERPEYAKDETCEYDAWNGPRPESQHYMPDWPIDQRTHYMMYEDTSEGTPISPAFETPEELARWLADTGASSFGGITATYEQWLRVAQGGYAPSMVISGGVMKSGVEAAL